ncbi:LysR substrate-binding domain-containing protein [Burkholderia sp. JPY481]
MDNYDGIATETPVSPNIRQIEAFRMVMITGTVTAAAERLCTSQPAVSRLLSLLEYRTGLKLFTRSKQRLQPTAEAAEYFREVQRAYIGLEKLQRAAWNIKHSATGELRIASIPVVGLTLLPRAIARFRASHPDVAITLQTRSSATVLDWIAAGKCDLGFATTSPDQPDLHVVQYASMPGVCIMPADHRLATKDIIRPRDLDGEEFVSLDSTDANRVALDRMFETLNVRRRTTLEVPYAVAIVAMVAQGLGVSVVSPLAVLDRQSSIVVKPFVPTIRFGFSLVHRRNFQPSLSSLTFLDCVKAELTQVEGAKEIRSEATLLPNGA